MDTSRATEALQREDDFAASNSFLDWAGILAGAFVAFAVWTVFVKFGLALGLSIAPLPAGTVRWGFPDTAFVVLMGVWVIFTQLSGLVAGGYVAGRMRRPSGEAAPEEMRVRDGMNGLAVWAVASTAMAIVTVGAISSGISGALSVAGGAAQTIAKPSTAYIVDQLMRPKEGTQAPGTPSPPNTANGNDDSAVVGRILERVSDFKLDESDKTYVAQVVSRRTGLTDQEARARIDDLMAKFGQEAERARKYGILAAFVSAVTALVGAIAAYAAAGWGGNHRDGASAEELEAARPL